MLDLLNGDLGQVRIVAHVKVALGQLVRWDSDDLLIPTAIIFHLHHANGAHIQNGAGHDGARIGHQHVNRVAIFRKRMRHEAIIPWIAHGCMQEAVHE